MAWSAAIQVASCLTTQIPDVSTKGDKMLLKPFSYGFTRELVLRATRDGNKKGADAYYYKDGHKMRSKPDVISYLSKNTEIPLSGDNFTFCKRSISKPPHEVVRQAKLSKQMIHQSPSTEKVEHIVDGKRRQRSQCHLCDSPSCAQHVTKRTKLQSPVKKSTDLVKALVPDITLTTYDAADITSKKQQRRSPPSNQDSDIKDRFHVTYSRVKSDQSKPGQAKLCPALPKNISGVANVVQSRTGASGELCNLHCPQAKGQPPTLQCVRCLCLFHPVCMQAFANVPMAGFTCKTCQKKSKAGVSSPEALKDVSLPTAPKRAILSNMAATPGSPKTYIRVRTVKSGTTVLVPATPQQRLIQVRASNTNSAVAMLLSVINKMKDSTMLSTVTSQLPSLPDACVVKSSAGSVQTDASHLGSLSSAMSTALCLQPRVVLKSPPQKPLWSARKKAGHPAIRGVKHVSTSGTPKSVETEDPQVTGLCNMGGSSSDEDRLTIDAHCESLPSLKISPLLMKCLSSPTPPSSAMTSDANNCSLTTSATEEPQTSASKAYEKLRKSEIPCSLVTLGRPATTHDSKAEDGIIMTPHKDQVQNGKESNLVTSETKFPHICDTNSTSLRVDSTLNVESPTSNVERIWAKVCGADGEVPRTDNAQHEEQVTVEGNVVLPGNRNLGKESIVKQEATMERLTSACRVLNQVFRFLSVPSLCRAAQVCTTWNSLAQQTHLWGEVNIVGIAIKDWDICTSTLCRRWTHTLVVEGSMWQSLAAHVQRLSVVQNLRVREATVSDLLVWANLFQHLTSFRASVYDPAGKRSPTEMGLEGFGRLTSLQDLILYGPQGLRLVQPILYPGFPFCGIRRLSLTTVVGGCPVECFLSSMTLLQELEFGSCTTWTSKSFQAVSELSQLRRLTLIDGGRVRGLSVALSKLKGLEKLWLKKWTFAENLGASLEQLPELAELHLVPHNFSVDAESNLNALLSCITLKTLKRFSWTVHNNAVVEKESVELPLYSDQVQIPFGSKCCDCPSVSSPEWCCPLSERVGFVLGSHASRISPMELADGLCRTLSCTNIVVQVDLAS